MKKIKVIVIVSIILLIGFLSGCETSAKDTDGDGHPDETDAFPNDRTEWLDSDSDFVGDNSDDFPDDPNESKDTDMDGYGDNADMFDDDANLHERIVIYNSVSNDPSGNEPWFIDTGLEYSKYWDVTSDSKYVEIGVSVLEYENGDYILNASQEGFNIFVHNPEGEKKFEEIPHRITVTGTNWGQWELRIFNFHNNPKIKVYSSIIVLK
jgi:hypothetical protein